VELLKLKKKILSKVQETETFNEARMILEKYDPQALRNMSMSLQNLSTIGQSGGRPSPSPMTPAQQPRSRSYTRPGPAGPQQQQQGSTQQRSMMGPPAIMPAIMGGPSGIMQQPGPAGPQQQARTVCPIPPAERSVVERMVDYMLSDGPGSRYALICFQCKRHNGMARQDEFDYISYCCAYCGFFNPARRARPQAPVQQMRPAIEAEKEPKVQEPDEEEGPKIEELDTVMNKTVSLFVCLLIVYRLLIDVFVCFDCRLLLKRPLETHRSSDRGEAKKTRRQFRKLQNLPSQQNPHRSRKKSPNRLVSLMNRFRMRAQTNLMSNLLESLACICLLFIYSLPF